MEIGRLETVAVHETQPTDARTCQVTDNRYPEAATPDDQDSAGTELRLARGAHFLQRHLP